MNHPVGCAVTVSHNGTIGRLSMEKWWWQHIYYVLNKSVNRASTTLGLAPWSMHGLGGDITPIIALSAAFLPKHSANNIATMSLKWASTGRPRRWSLYARISNGCAAIIRHNQIISCLSGQQRLRQHRYYVLKMSANGASTTFANASW